MSLVKMKFGVEIDGKVIIQHEIVESPMFCCGR